VTDLLFRPDEIGRWSELKLEIVEKYGAAYTRTFLNFSYIKKYYIDAFSGAGIHISKATGAPIDGSPTRALKVTPAFDGFYFIDLDAEKTDFLRALCKGRHNTKIHTGDCNAYLKAHVLPAIQNEKYSRALCLLDPYKLDLDWEIIFRCGQSRAVDLFLNFPVMDINRNAIRRNPEQVLKGDVERMNRLWGDESWRDAGYAVARQGSFFGLKVEKRGNREIVEAFRDRLRVVAGFGFVSKPLAMRNSKNAILYYLVLASPKAVAKKIIDDIFQKYDKPPY
jgi:three-Cys-motif partner protein